MVKYKIESPFPMSDYLGVDDEDVALVDAVVLVQDVEEDVEQRAAAGVGGGF